MITKTSYSSGIRIHRKYQRLIFTGLMALLMSLIISTALIFLKEGYSEHFFNELLRSWLGALPLCLLGPVRMCVRT